MAKEIWKNSTKGTILVNVRDHNGAEVQKVVRSGKTIQLSAEERIYMNTERAMNPDNDVFNSGAMTAVILDEETPDAAEIKANPNQVTEEDLDEMLDFQWQKFDKALADISNLNALLRLYEKADADEGSTVRQLKSIKARVHEVDPSYLFDED